MGIRDQVADVTLPMAVALFRATGPAMNVAVAFYVAHWLGYEPTPGQMIAATAVGGGDELWRDQPAGRDQLHQLDRADRHGAGRADRAARLAGRGRDGPGHLPDARQRHARRRGDRGVVDRGKRPPKTERRMTVVRRTAADERLSSRRLPIADSGRALVEQRRTSRRPA